MNDYVKFTSTGIKVDLNRFLKTENGKKTLRELQKFVSSVHKCPDCGSPDRGNEEPKIGGLNKPEK